MTIMSDPSELCRTMGQQLPGVKILHGLTTVLVLYNIISSWILVTADTSVSCPIGCQCIDGNSIYLCQKSNLTKMPTGLQKSAILLDLDHNHIFEIGNSSLDSVTNLEILSLADNRISIIGSNAFYKLSKLKVLSLRNNKIGLLPQNVFIKNYNLQVLDLSHNLLYYIPHKAIFYLFKLEVLNISYNSIASSYLGAGFRYTTHLKMLDLTGNQIPSVEMDSFQATVWWEESVSHFINLSYCNIRHVHDNAFKDLNHITGMTLRGNRAIPQQGLKAALADIPSKSLLSLDLSDMNIPTLKDYFQSQQFYNLESLDLSGNVLRAVEAGTLSFMEKLLHLDLSSNKISFIQSLTGLDNLESLNLGHNRLSLINLTTFDGLQNLKTLDLSFNSLTTLSGEPFQNLWYLETWDISHNKLTGLDVEMGFEHLKTIVFTHNQLKRANFVKTLPRVQHIDISFNQIDALYVDTFSKGQIVKKFNVSNNGLSHVDPLTFHPSGLKVLDLSHNKLQQVAHFGWSSPLKELYLSYNNISHLAANSFEGLNGLEVLHLSHCNQYRFPAGIFNDFYQLKELDISSNSIGTYIVSSSANALFQNMENLERLDLSETSLTDFPRDLFVNRITLRYINLNNNHISSIKKQSFSGMMNVREVHISSNWITTFDSHTFSQLTSLETLDITENPFKCTCDLKSSCDWLVTTYVDITNFQTGDATSCFNEEVVNNNEDGTNNSVHNKLPLYQYCSQVGQRCGDILHPNLILWVSCAAVLLIVLIIVVIILCKVCNRDKRKKTQQQMLAKMEKELESEQEKMIFDNLKYKYNINNTKEDKL